MTITANDVRRVLHLDASNEVLTDTEINEYLKEAKQDLFSEIKREKESQLIGVHNNSKGELIKTYSLTLAPVVSIHKVFVNDSLLDSSNYSLDEETNEIIFTDGIALNDIVRVFYLPKVYELAELYICAYNINVATNILSRGGSQSPVADTIERKRDRFLEVINSRLIISSWR